MGYDPASNAAVSAALTARSDGQSFQLVSESTTLLQVDHPLQRAVLPQTPNRLLVRWAARYRNYPLGSYKLSSTGGTVVDGLVCDVKQLTLATGLLLAWAQTQFDLLDLALLLIDPGTGQPAVVPNPLQAIATQPAAPARRWTGLNWVNTETGQATG